MTDYNFWADLPDTFKSSPDWIKAFELGRAPCDAAAVSKLARTATFPVHDRPPFAFRCFPLWFAPRSAATGRSRGLETSQEAVGVDRNGTSSTYMAGEASAYVQSFGLKAVAVVFLRLSNSPVTRGQPR